MIKLVKEVFLLLTNSQKQRFYFLQFLVVVMAFAELLGIASIAPFMALLGDIGMLQRDNFLSEIYRYSGVDSERDFVILVGTVVLLTLVLSSLVSMYTTWKLSIYATKVGTEIADQLYSYYMSQGWLFHTSNNSADLTKKIVNETERLTMQVLLPFMILNSRLVLSIVISFTLFLYDPVVATAGLLLFGLTYFVLFKYVRRSLNANGERISEAHSTRYRLINEGFGGFKDITLFGRQKTFVQRFALSGKSLAQGLGVNNAISMVPRYAVELLAFGSMIALILVLFDYYNGNLGQILPVLSIYVLAGFKLLPAFQHVYSSLAQIKGALPAYLALRGDLISSYNMNGALESEKDKIDRLKKEVVIKDAYFTYPGNNKPDIHHLNLVIPAKSVVGFVGPSGSGKSTIIDILLTLIDIDKGTFMVDDVTINNSNKYAWRQLIGFVPQIIFLSEGTICENVAFGIPLAEINITKVEKALKLAHLTETVSKLEKGLHTMVGERGVKLSGGQRQRLGIARALYHDPDILVFDEATSALDGLTEKLIMDAIQEFHGTKTIIMIAHRLKTVQMCERIYFVDAGSIVDSGSYQELYLNNQSFKKMADHS